ncbi:class I SAM-dependent methyltransferase [Gilvimarinus algae]|uniref:Class I SAM-dependent methyltransferase n=1 Tax=Gilvimarinus algae TaxID=3058037 RepID=A0ABT8TMS3_9GAMM|nr:class I SAM-dependent methyltransferase [Gilvimarinus sp. SDUM040014]MDO3383697.1 class I SAM-dependent methyltransferase [Gilvimarinus sp. SDUM040014]
MTVDCHPALAGDPTPPNWAELELEATWADELNLARPTGLWRFLRSVLGKPKAVQIDRSHPMIQGIPKYALQEFHNLPNGNYSSRIAHGYITGFDRAMLGTMGAVREAMARQVAGAGAVLDLGTAGGKLAAAVSGAGVEDVWGADVSPYLLKHAASRHPQVRFIQAPAESLPFAAGRFGAVVVSFLFHEMPPKYIRQALAEIHRVLRPGGQLLVAEPSALQLAPVAGKQLLSAEGWRHLYFRALAKRAHEPFVMAWHRLDKAALFSEAGFELSDHQDRIPINLYSLKKRSAAPGDVVA